MRIESGITVAANHFGMPPKVNSAGGGIFVYVSFSYMKPALNLNQTAPHFSLHVFITPVSAFYDRKIWFACMHLLRNILNLDLKNGCMRDGPFLTISLDAMLKWKTPHKFCLNCFTCCPYSGP
jgi:hypothetical protein